MSSGSKTRLGKSGLMQATWGWGRSENPTLVGTASSGADVPSRIETSAPEMPSEVDPNITREQFIEAIESACILSPNRHLILKNGEKFSEAPKTEVLPKFPSCSGCSSCSNPPMTVEELDKAFSQV